MTNNIYYELAYRLQNCRLSYLHKLLYLFIITTVILNFTGCKSQKATTSKNEALQQNGNQEPVHLKMLVKSNSLKGDKKVIEVIIKVEGKNSEIRLEDFKLKAEFLGEHTFKSNLSYVDSAQQIQTVKSINKILTEFTELTAIGTASPTKHRCVPIKLNLNHGKQDTKLRLNIELLDNQNNVIEKQEVVWIKVELLMCNLHELEGETMGNFVLKNATNIPFDPDKIKLELTSTNKLACQFVKTSSNKATLKQLLGVNDQALAPGAETDPIALQITGVPKNKKPSKIKLTITQENSNKKLATHIL